MNTKIFFFLFLVMIISILPNDSSASSVTQLCGEEICSNEKIIDEVFDIELTPEDENVDDFYEDENVDDFYEDENNKIYGEIVPDLVKNVMPSIVTNLDETESEELAENAMLNIFDIVENTIIDEGGGFILETFGDRIVEMLYNGFSGLFEKTAALFN